jgi:hypothetical protein
MCFLRTVIITGTSIVTGIAVFRIRIDNIAYSQSVNKQKNRNIKRYFWPVSGSATLFARRTQTCSGCNRCYGSESAIFWASRIRIRYSEVRIRIRIPILLSSSKIRKNNHAFTVFHFFITFYLQKIIQKVVRKKNFENKNFLNFWVGVLKATDEESRILIRIGIKPKMLDSDPDEMDADPQPCLEPHMTKTDP